MVSKAEVGFISSRIVIFNYDYNLSILRNLVAIVEAGIEVVI